MPAKAARNIEPESAEYPASFRTQNALRNFGITSANRRKTDNETIRSDADSQKNARKRASLRVRKNTEIEPNVARSQDPPSSSPPPRNSEGRWSQKERSRSPAPTLSTPPPHEARRKGYSRAQLHPLPTTALTLHSEQTRDRHAEDTARLTNEHGATTAKDFPIETGRRVFLEQDTPPVRERSEEEVEKERQAKQLETAKQLFVSGVPEITSREMLGGATEETEGTAKTGISKTPATEAPRQAALQIQLQAIQTQARLNAEREAEADETEQKKRAAADALGRLRLAKIIRLLFIEAASVGTVVGAFVFIIHANIAAFGNGKMDFPPFVYKNVKVPFAIKAAIAVFDILLFVAPLIIFALNVILLFMLIFTAVHFNLLTVIYGIFAPLFGF